MEEDGIIGDAQPARGWFGVEIYRYGILTVYCVGRWRFIWHDPRFRENWQLDATFNDEVRQIGIGPAVFAYIRRDE